MYAEGAFQLQPTLDLERHAVDENATFSRLHALIAPLTIQGMTVEDILVHASERLEGSDSQPARELARRLLMRAHEVEYNTQVALLASSGRRSSSRKGALVNG